MIKTVQNVVPVIQINHIQQLHLYLDNRIFMLSQFVYETDNLLLHSITNRVLPINASEALLRANHFYKDQNEDAIKDRLSRIGNHLSLNIVPTWECSLRCGHCCVLYQLKKEDLDKIDPTKLYSFLDSYFTKFSSCKSLTIGLIGGESLLYPKEVLELMNVCSQIKDKFGLKYKIKTTTNLAYDLELEHVKIFDQLEVISISVDGLEPEHNFQRRAYKQKDINPFWTTINNIKRLIDLGFRDKLRVQAALRDELIKEDYIIKFKQYMTEVGILLEHISIGSIAETKQNSHVSESWKAHKKNSVVLNSRPCCKYRYMSKMQLNPDGVIYDNFYTTDNARLGTLDDSIEMLAEKNLELIFKHMPALKDKNCLSCPVLGYCWGGCVIEHITIKDRPSSICSRNKLIPHVQQLALKGKLITK